LIALFFVGQEIADVAKTFPGMEVIAQIDKNGGYIMIQELAALQAVNPRLGIISNGHG
jgi:hypothetical protein